MKKLLFIISLSSFSVPLLAQNYFPFPDSNAVWRVDWATAGCMNQSLPQASYQYVLNGDTVISSTTYQKLERSGVCLMCCTPPLMPRNGYMGAMRQDTGLKQVYYVPADSVIEQLLYDFSLGVGDTVKGYLIDAPGVACTYALVDSIDSVLVAPDYRKRFHFTSDVCAPVYFIDGIGSTYGLLEPFFVPWMDVTSTLICVKVDGQTIYPDTAALCDIVTGTKEQNVGYRVNIHPNPTTGKFQIQSPESQRVQVFDLLGREVKGVRRKVSAGTMEVDLSAYPSGIYFVRVGELVRKLVLSK